MHNSTPLSALRNLLLAQGLDGMIVPRADAHQSEDCTPHDNKLAWLTGFSGSAGLALVLRDRALMFVDGRYQVQCAMKSRWMILKFTIYMTNRWPTICSLTLLRARVSVLNRC